MKYNETKRQLLRVCCPGTSKSFGIWAAEQWRPFDWIYRGDEVTSFKVRMFIFGLLAMLYGVGIGLFHVLPAILMNSRGISCPATVIRLNREKPETLDYVYVVDSNSYNGVGLLNRFPGVHPGSQITVHHLPERPAISYAGDTAVELENVAITAALASIFIPLALAFAIPIRLISELLISSAATKVVRMPKSSCH